VALNSCTAALHLANVGFGIGPGDEVIVPSLTFAATANAVFATGAGPVFADVVGKHDWTIDPEDVARKITPRTKAVCVMHYAGYPCDMAALARLCADAGVILFEDAAHGLGGTLDGRGLGTLSRAGCYSFYSNKIITTAEGGMIVTDDPDLALRYRRLRSHGMTATAVDRARGSLGYDIVEAGFNYRLDDIRAALGRVQMTRLDPSLARRRVLVAAYAERLAAIDGVSLPNYGGRGEPAHYILPILVERGDRDAIRRRMNDLGVQTSFHYPPVHRFRHYTDQGAIDLPWTEWVTDRSITLPLYPELTLDEVDFVVDVLRKSIDG